MATHSAVRPLPTAAAAGRDAPAVAGGDGWAVVAALGCVLALAGWTDLLLGLFPARPGNPDWEFGAVSRLIDALPLGTLGLGALAAAAAARGRAGTLRALSWAAWGVVLGLLAVLALYALAAPVVWRAVAPPVRPPLAAAMSKTAVMAVGYLVFYAWLGRFARRAALRGARR